MNTYNPNPNYYNKRNFHEALNLIVPDLYEEKDIDLSGVGLDDIDQIINSNILAAEKASTVLFVSGYSDISAISQFFVKQNELTKITTQSFEDKILSPLGRTIDSFATNQDFTNYLSSVLLPKIVTNTSSLAVSTASAFDNTASGTHYYLADNLGWYYFLNQSGLGSLVYEPSSYVLSGLSTLYLNNTLETLDGVKGFVTYLWHNYATKSQISSNSLIPQTFLSGTSTYTSGTQQLDKLETLLEVIYSKSYMDRQDFKVKDAFDNYLNGLGLINTLNTKGPFRKFLRAIGYSMADVNNDIEKLESLYDIETCPEQYLPYLAQLIDWKLMGPDPVKWRHQLRSAVDIYKKKGTSIGLQYAMNALLTDNILDVSGQISELWESYLPFMIWYALATESIHFKSLKTWTTDKAQTIGIYNYDPASLENNIKIAIDYVLLEAYKRYPTNFRYENKTFPAQRFVTLNRETGEPEDIYTLVSEPLAKPYYFNADYSSLLSTLQVNENKENLAFENCFHDGPDGEGIYLASENYAPNRPVYLSSTGDSAFVFNYRNQNNFPIPPFEEIKYFVGCDLTKELTTFLVEKLKCLGVRESFANDFGSYLASATYGSDRSLDFRNDFLMFFSSMQNPSNYFSVLQDRSSVDNAIFSLWNGKSSHVFLNLLALSFNFTSKDYSGDGRYSIQATKTVLNKFLPAHAIPKITLDTSAEVDPYVVKNTEFNSVNFDKQQTMYSVVSGVYAGYELSGLSMGDISPGTDTGRSGLNTFKRADVDTLQDNLVSGTTFIVAPRNSLRRRNYKYVLPSESYYDRTGFNQPISFDPSVLELTMASSVGILPLGYIPSSNSYYPVYSPLRPSSVWDYCENLDSNNSYFGVNVSSTFPCRGLSALGSDIKYTHILDRHDKYIDRGQVDPIFVVMNKIKDKEAVSKAEIYVSANKSDYYGSINKIDHVRSLANGYINSGVVGINSFTDYENFKFGKGIHKLFRDYKKYFNHNLGYYYLDRTGANIFAHTFGPLLYNADLSVEGSAVNTMAGSYIASSLNSIIPVTLSSTGAYIASATNSVPISVGSITSQYRNPHILSGVELCFFSSLGPNTSKFEILKLDPSLYSQTTVPYAVGKTLLKCFTPDYAALRFDLSSYGEIPNTFIKDHQFKLTFRGQSIDDSITEFGGREVYIWIHTNIIQAADGNNYLWSWTPRQQWELTKYNPININQIISGNRLAHICKFKNAFTVITDPGTTINSELRCLGNEVVDFQTEIQNPTPPPILELKEEYLDTFEINFDTRNYTNYNNYEYLEIIPSPDIYHKIRKAVHDTDINYFVEVIIPGSNNNNKSILIDKISIQDLTLKENSGFSTNYGIETSSIPLTPFVTEYKYYTDKEELRTILKFFNSLTENPYTTRNATISSPILDTSGGSRLNYRIHPVLITRSTFAGTGQITSIDFNN
jgi:phage tail-like protein